jgi:hypothetical protein
MILRIYFSWLCVAFLLTESFAAVAAGGRVDPLREVVQLKAGSPYAQRADGLALNALDQLRHLEQALAQELRKPSLAAVNRALVTALANVIGELVATRGFTLGGVTYRVGF